MREGWQKGAVSAEGEVVSVDNLQGSNKVDKNFQDKDEDLGFKTRHLLQLVEWVKNTLDLQVGDHHNHLGEKLFKINACRSHQAVVVQVITAMICELMPFAEGFDHHHQVTRSVVETGAKADVGRVQHAHPVSHVQVAAHFCSAVPYLERG